MAVTLEKFDWEANWLGNISVKYNYRTVIERSRLFKEQRRALLSAPSRSIKADFVLQSTEVRKFANDIRALVLQVLAVPIFTEVFTPTEDLQGDTVLNLSQTTANYWNLNNSSIILLKSPTLSELKQIQSIGANSITVTSFVVGDFKKATTRIYPCMPGMIESRSFGLETVGVVSCELDFREFFLDWTL